jgi:predicted neuraminidase
MLRHANRHDTIWRMRATFLLLLPLLSLPAADFKSEQIFPPEPIHNHSSSIVELPNGDLLACWYNGSGERQADDVKIEGSRMKKGSAAWSPRFLLYDTPGFPDTNPVLYVDSLKRVWLFWGLIVANEWHTAILKYVRSDTAWDSPAAPRWQWSSEILLKPANLLERTQQYYEKELKRAGPLAQYGSRTIALAADKYFSRMGWFTRTHPIELPSGRMILPLYSDGYSFGLMALSDDHGDNWKASEPIVGMGPVQPSVVRRKSGELVAYLRDNGPPPKRIMQSISKDDGFSWSPAVDLDIPNPGSSVEAIALADGRWVLVYNDTEKDRNSLAISLSADEGQTWKWTRHIERSASGRYHYPSVIQSRDGAIHVTYSQYTGRNPEVQTIVHARLSVDWILSPE